MANLIIYMDSGGNVDNSGCTDQNTANLSGSSATVSGSVVTLDGSPDLSGVATDGSWTINIKSATNTNQAIFRITAVDNGAKTVTVENAPTGVTTSSWKIGGRISSCNNGIKSTMALGLFNGRDEVVINNSLTGAGILIYVQGGGATPPNNTNGFMTIRPASGAGRPVITSTNTQNAVTLNIGNVLIYGLELAQQGASGSALSHSGGHAYDMKISDAGGAGVTSTGGLLHTGLEISGTGGVGLSDTYSVPCLSYSYIHDCGSHGYQMTSSLPADVLVGNVIENNNGRGVYVSSSALNAAAIYNRFALIGNTIVGNVDGGIELADDETRLLITNNIFMNNGNASGEANIEFKSATRAGWDVIIYNIVYQDATTLATGAVNTINLTLDATNIEDDPLFTNLAGGDYSLQSGSPAKAAGYSGFMTNYLDIGALQARGAGLLAHPGMRGGFA